MHVTLPNILKMSFQYVSSVQLFSCVQLFVTPWPAACQVSLSITNTWSLLKLMIFELVMPSNHLILCRPLLLLPSIFPSIRVLAFGTISLENESLYLKTDLITAKLCVVSMESNER